MTDPGTYPLLTDPDVMRAVEENLGREPAEIALDRRVPHAAVVATQVKYLRRARTKLPAYYAARCILPPRAFEQASSKAAAARKSCAGQRALDLTCGLGVDSLYLARRFRRVVALERDPALAQIAAENFRRLDVGNVEVVCTDAESYLAAAGERFDWIFADPDRRDAVGRKQLRLEACSPDVLALGPALERLSGRLCLKNSPLFDVDEAFRLFPRCRVEAVSLGGECKEVVIYADGSGPRITAVALGLGEVSAIPGTPAPPPPERFAAEEYRYLIVPDVALRKARLSRRHLAGRADAWSDNGFGFARERPSGVLGRVLEIARIDPWRPKLLRRELRGRGVETLLRDFPFPAARILRELGAHEGGEVRLALTKIGNDCWAIRLK